MKRKSIHSMQSHVYYLGRCFVNLKALMIPRSKKKILLLFIDWKK